MSVLTTPYAPSAARPMGMTSCRRQASQLQLRASQASSSTPAAGLCQASTSGAVAGIATAWPKTHANNNAGFVGATIPALPWLARTARPTKMNLRAWRANATTGGSTAASSPTPTPSSSSSGISSTSREVAACASATTDTPTTTTDSSEATLTSRKNKAASKKSKRRVTTLVVNRLKPPASSSKGGRKFNKDAYRPNPSSDSGKNKPARNTRQEKDSYQVAAFLSTLGLVSAATLATYFRFEMHAATEGTGVAAEELLASLMLTAGGAVGMEMWARWAHRELWHDAWWNYHESHHRPREGMFEANDIFAVINAPVAMALTAYGFWHEGIFAGACFGAGLGITLFGIGYMFVHDGLVHRRFPVGPIADVPYMKRVAAAHTLHHAEKYNGVPWGLFLGPQELEELGPEAMEDLDKLVTSRDKFLALKSQVQQAEASAKSQTDIQRLVQEAAVAEKKAKDAANPK
ncbi:beta-carotene 3-hydroxylase [Pycnococcus provasolii]